MEIKFYKNVFLLFVLASFYDFIVRGEQVRYFKKFPALLRDVFNTDMLPEKNKYVGFSSTSDHIVLAGYPRV